MPDLPILIGAAVLIGLGAEVWSEVLDRLAKAAARRDVEARSKQRGRL